MQLPYGLGDKLAAFGTSVTNPEVQSELVRILIGFGVIILLWPYVVEVVVRWWRVLTQAHASERDRREALEAILERHKETSQQDAGERPVTVIERAVRQKLDFTPAKVRPTPPDTFPLTTLDELLSYDRPDWGQGFAPVRPHSFRAAPFPPLKSRLLVCHDLAGGYGEDRWVQGGGFERPYRMYDWGLIDIFVYFSHKLVTIPPAGWTDVAHRHGTRVLGTFITEWDAGYDICARLLGSRETAERAAAKLAQIAVDYGFDGWLVNIENKVDPGANIDTLVFFLKSLTQKMRAAKASGESDAGSSSEASASAADNAASASTAASMVLWYDSVTVDGKLAWQDQLNDMNRVFFEACDGIFTNYAWKSDYPVACAARAGPRRFDVYMGIDTFGRGTWGGGGFDADKALKRIRLAGVSAALFAPSWTMEDKTSGGGKVDPAAGRGWTEVEDDFGRVDGEFWAKVAAAWQPPRALPGSRAGCSASELPLVLNFGRGIGDAWRIRGQEVARFRPVQSTGGEPSRSGDVDAPRTVQVLGGAYYDLASQCLTLLIASHGGKAPHMSVAGARRLGDSKGTAGGANGTLGARYIFAESFDGASCLCFTGLMNDKVIATFPLFRCHLALPAEPLEVRVAFSANADSEIALVLVLDIPGEVDGGREIVLRGWGKEGPPRVQPRFSKRLTNTDLKASYAPAEEVAGIGQGRGATDEDGLQAQIRELRESGESYEAIWEALRKERAGSGIPSHTTSASLERSSGAGTSNDGSATIPPAGGTPRWTTRKYVVRDLRLGGYRAIREIRVTCVRKKGRDSSSDSDRPLRLYAGTGRQMRGVAGLAAYRMCLGEVCIGPWNKVASSMFGRIECLRVSEVSYGEAGADGESPVLVDLSLEWVVLDSEARESRTYSDAEGLGGLWRPLHFDLWQARDQQGQAWRWLGRSYGRKHRLRGLQVDAGVETDGLVLAVQQVNMMGYRQDETSMAALRIFREAGCLSMRKSWEQHRAYQDLEYDDAAYATPLSGLESSLADYLLRNFFFIFEKRWQRLQGGRN